MTKKIKCKDTKKEQLKLRVKIIKPPIIDTSELRRLVAARATAIVL